MANDKCGDCGGKGWGIYNETDAHSGEVQRCDTCKMLPDDDTAIEAARTSGLFVFPDGKISAEPIFTPGRLKLWTRPECYIGAEWPEYYRFLGKHRDSDTLTVSNFRSGLRKIGGESETVLVIEENHWAVGWVAWIGIHRSDAEALRKADEIMHELEGYPVVDGDDWGKLEDETIYDYWESEPLRCRVDLCRDHGVSVFAARRANDVPEAIYNYLRDAIC